MRYVLITLCIVVLLIFGISVLVEWLQAKHVGQGLVIELDLCLQYFCVKYNVVEVLLSSFSCNIKLVN